MWGNRVSIEMPRVTEEAAELELNQPMEHLLSGAENSPLCSEQQEVGGGFQTA